MESNRVRFALALIITGGYVTIVGMLVVAVVATEFDREHAIEIIEEISKVMAGFIGLIIGYYFSRGASGSNSTDEPKPGPQPERDSPVDGNAS